MSLALPEGWTRQELMRKNGLSAGKIDIFYYSPSGRKFRTKPQLARYLGDSVDLTTFDYRTGKINSSLMRKNKRSKSGLMGYDYTKNMRNDSSLIPPIRQTASIFKQPVTVIKSQPDSRVKSDLKHGQQNEKPKQLFWEKRLEKLDVEREELDNFELPINMKPVGPHMTKDTLLRSIATALHIHTQPITGQMSAKEKLEKEPAVYLNPEQPLVHTMIINDDDIKRQELRVQSVRQKLEKALNECEI
ncbi:methyl-CpG-binding domain protein 2-like [Oppia nitens]|uniref:methyl-CpG-binding domain protein 2-like n=1 Tax=Oppia nitens TaxID=1686743 RepID=UPI0023D9DD12|nr:methyl-CpG-binding domain protein 2-like [Oppia nitens]